MFQAYRRQISLHQRPYLVGGDYLAVQEDAGDDRRLFNKTSRPDCIQRVCEMSGPNDGSGGGERSRAKIGTKEDGKSGRLATKQADDGHV